MIHYSSSQLWRLRVLIILTLLVWSSVLGVEVWLYGFHFPFLSSSREVSSLVVVSGNAQSAQPPQRVAFLSPTPEELPATPEVTPTAIPTLPPPTPTPPPSIAYVVRPGEWLYSIARQFDVDPNRLAAFNGLTDSNRLEAGQTLYILVSPTPSPMPSPTPTLPPTPIVATPEPMPTLPPVWPFAPPRQLPSLPIPPNLITVLLLGAEGTTNWRTDSIMLVMYNPDTMRAGLLSIPRDLWIAVPGYGYHRINEVDYLAERTKYPGGGPALLQRVFKENLGLSFDHYVRVHFDGFIRIVDALGGVEVVVDCPIEDIFPDPRNPDETIHMKLEPGKVHLDGTLALLYSRSRLSTSDFDRTRRQQQVIKGLWQQVRRVEILPRIPRLYRELNDAFVTDLEVDDVVRLAEAALRVEPQNVQSFVIQYPLVEGWHTPEGAAVLLLKDENLFPALADFFEQLAQPPSPAYAEHATVVVENQTPYPNWAEVAVSRVEWAGASVVNVVNAPSEGAQTRLIVYRERPATLAALLKSLGLREEQVERRPPQADSPDMVLIVGHDFAVCRR